MFLVESVRILDQHHGKVRLVKLQISGMVPVGMAGDRTLVAAAAIDYAPWDKSAAELAQRKDLKAKRKVLLIPEPGNAGIRQGGLEPAHRTAGLGAETQGCRRASIRPPAPAQAAPLPRRRPLAPATLQSAFCAKPRFSLVMRVPVGAERKPICGRPRAAPLAMVAPLPLNG